MTTAFDPYYKWLGIPPTEQPANLYRLLGITVFESDPEVIESAAEQRMSHLRTLQSGPFGPQSQTLLNEVAAAKVCLLKPERKLDYDRALRGRLAMPVGPVPLQAADAGQQSAPPFTGDVFPPSALSCPRGTDCGFTNRSPALVNRSPETDEPSGAIELESLGIAPPMAVHPHKEPKLPPIAWIAGPLSLAVIVVLGIALVMEARKDLDYRGHLNRNPAPTESLRGGQVAQPAPGNPATHPPQSQSNSAIKRPDNGNIVPNLASRQANEQRELGTVEESSDSNKLLQPDSTVEQPSDNGPSPPQTDATRAPEQSAAATLSVATDQAPSPAARSEAAALTPAESRHPIPGGAAQQAALREIREVMSDEMTAAKTADSQRALARKLDELASDTPNDPALRYVLMTESLEFAIRACDVALANDLVQRLTKLYDLDAWEFRERTWTRLSQTAPGGEARSVLVKDAMRLADEAIREDRFDLAVELAASAAALSTMLKDKTIRDQARDAVERAKRMQMAATAAQAAFDRLLMTPDDAEANLIVGRFRCLEKQDWETGLPFLLRGADEDLRELARQETRHPASAADQLKLADAWWDMAERANEKREGPSHEPLRARAVHWYREAAPGLTGLALLKAQKRSGQLDSNAADTPPANSSVHR